MGQTSLPAYVTNISQMPPAPVPVAVNAAPAVQPMTTPSASNSTDVKIPPLPGDDKLVAPSNQDLHLPSAPADALKTTVASSGDGDSLPDFDELASRFEQLKKRT
jgi:hypothetical protein